GGSLWLGSLQQAFQELGSVDGDGLRPAFGGNESSHCRGGLQQPSAPSLSLGHRSAAPLDPGGCQCQALGGAVCRRGAGADGRGPAPASPRECRVVVSA